MLPFLTPLQLKYINMPFQIGPKQEEWLQYLEQHPEQQLRKRLGKKVTDDTIKTCCLGAALLMTGKYKWERGFLFCTALDREKDHSPYYIDNYKDLGLIDNKGSLKIAIIDKNKDPLIEIYNSISLMNDYGFTWTEIAAAIRANPGNFFSESI